MNSYSCEVLAPCGSFDSLVAAVRCGADAVYLGGQSLNARRGAANFDDEALAQAVRYCHERDVKLYLTLNTLVFDDEIAQLISVLKTACEIGVDALIVQDMAVAALAKRCAPQIKLHGSTQMSVHSLEGVKMLEDMGFARVVLARELSGSEIVHIRKGSSIELECFVHGALCMSVSGQCYLSSMIGGRSGNRGMCAQPCRLPFSSPKRKHALSLKDMSHISKAVDLAELGVASLKIEGRMKRPEYVAAAVTACCQSLDGVQPDYDALQAVFSRSGFTSGYYDGQTGRDMFGTRQKDDVQAASSAVLSQLGRLFKDERQSVSIQFELDIREGKPVQLTVTDNRGNTVVATGDIPQEARTSPTTPERAAAALEKTGGTPYTVSNIKSNIDDGLIVPASQLNALRRETLEKLAELRSKSRLHKWNEPELAKSQYSSSGNKRFRARISRAYQLTDEFAKLVDEIALPIAEFKALSSDQLAKFGDKLMVELPAVSFDNQSKVMEILQLVKNNGVTKAIVGGLGAIRTATEMGFETHGDYSLNIVNSVAVEEYEKLGLGSFTSSFELSASGFRELGGNSQRGILAYGYLPMMTTRNCPAGECSDCGRSFPELVDRLENRFFVDCAGGVSTLYNCVPLYVGDKLGDFSKADFFTLYFTKESPGECIEITRELQDKAVLDGKKTHGLYYRKVL